MDSQTLAQPSPYSTWCTGAGHVFMWAMGTACMVEPPSPEHRCLCGAVTWAQAHNVEAR